MEVTNKNISLCWAVYRKNSPNPNLQISPMFDDKGEADAVATRINQLVDSDLLAANTLLQQIDAHVFVKEHKIYWFIRGNGKEDHVVGGAQ